MSTEVKKREVAPGVEPEPDLIDCLGVCRRLSVKPSTWRMRIATGTAPMPFVRMGSRNYYRTADIRAFLENARWPDHMKFRRVRPKD